MHNTNAVDPFNRRRSPHLPTEDRHMFYFPRRSRFSRRQAFFPSASLPSTTSALNLPPGLPHNIFGKDTKHHNDNDGNNNNSNGNGNGNGNGNNNNNNDDDDSSDDGDMDDNNNNPFAPSTTSQSHGHGQTNSMNMMAASTSLPEATVTLTISSSSATLHLTSSPISTTTPFVSTTVTSTISFLPTYITSTALAANTMLTVSSTSSQTTTTDGPSAESTVTPAPSVQVHKASISAPTIAAAVVASLIGAVAVFAFGYLLFRYCTSLKAKVFAYRARRGERLPGEEDGGLDARDSAPDMSEVNYSSDSGAVSEAATVRQSVVRQSMTARQSAADNSAPAYPADLINVPFQSEKNQDSEDHPFSNQVPLAASDVGSNHVPSLQQSIIVGLVMGSTLGSIPDSRPPTYMTHASETDPVSTIINEYAGPSRSASASSASSGIHPTGLSANPPTPVVSRDSARSGVAAGSSRQLSVAASSFLMPSTPAPAYFSAPTPPASVIGYSPSTNRVRASVTPSESASNAPSSPLPLPPGLLLNTTLPNVPALSRFSWNSSSIAVGAKNRMSSVQRFANGGASASAHADAVPSISANPPMPPLTLPSFGSQEVECSVISHVCRS